MDTPCISSYRHILRKTNIVQMIDMIIWVLESCGLIQRTVSFDPYRTFVANRHLLDSPPVKDFGYPKCTWQI